MTLADMLNHRRAVRDYADTPIDVNTVKQCLKLAQLSPSSSNLQLYEFYHITDKAMLDALAKACLSQQTAVSAQQMVVFVTRGDLYADRAKAAMRFEIGNVQKYSPKDRQNSRIKNLKRYYGALIPAIYARSAAVAGARRLAFGALAKLRPAFIEVSGSDVQASIHKSCALAAQTFMLAMSEQGLDTCPMEGFDSARVKKLLKLPKDAQINMIISCGIRSEKGVWGDRFRVPFDEVYREI